MSFQNVTPEYDYVLWERRDKKVSISALVYALGQFRIQLTYDYGDRGFFDVIAPEM